jgi:membrane protease YdiL (CAAX protease family)
MPTLPQGTQRSILSRIFLSSSEPRLRAGWRLIIQTILMLLLLSCIGIPAGLMAYLPNMSMSDQQLMLLDQGISLIAIIVSVFITRRYLDKRSLSSMGLRVSSKLLWDIVAGFLIAFLSLTFVYLLETSFGWAKFNAFAWELQTPASVVGGTLQALFTFFLVGWNEELLSRGYHLQTISSGSNMLFGLVGSSIIFGLLHIFNPNVTWISIIGIIFAGLFLGFGYIRTQQLWLPIGLHIGWNFSEGVIFGFPVSGWNGFQITNNTFSGPLLWTGGLFGPEAGLIILPALLLGTALIYVYTLPKFTNR